MKILIIEDDELMSRMYKKIFTFEGLDVEIAENGELGLEKVKAYQPDLILLDVMMPKINGLQVLDQLKSDQSTDKIPVLMLTNLAGQQDAQQALQKGALQYIIKSEHEPHEVVTMVKQVLGQNSKTPTVPQQS